MTIKIFHIFLKHRSNTSLKHNDRACITKYTFHAVSFILDQVDESTLHYAYLTH